MSTPPEKLEGLWNPLLYRMLSAAARRLARRGPSGLWPVATKLGEALWFGLPSRRRLATRNISECLELSPKQARELARESFHHNAMSFLEAVLTADFGLEHPLLHRPDPEIFTRFQDPSRPVVSVTGHLGAWELEASMLGELRASNVPRLVVVRRNSNPALHQLMTDFRCGRGAQMLGHRDSALSVLRALKKKGLVAFLVDHNTSRDEAVFLPFLGKMAAVNRGPAFLAVRSESIIWPIALLRDKGRYVVNLEESLDTATLEGDTEARTLAAARFYTEAIERLVRKAPEQWFWMHNRWKTQQEA